MKKVILTVLIASSFLFVSCDKDPIDKATVELKNEVNDFVWKSMNIWYNWQPDVANLADSKNNNIDEYYSFLNNYSNSEDLFDDLLFDAGNTDRFSWFVEDYEVQNQQFQGISKVFGFRRSVPIQFNTDGDIVFYLQYVIPNSPADNAGLKRGDIVYAIDDVAMDATNYSQLLSRLSNPTVKLSFAEVDNENLTLTPTDDKTITSAEVADNPVYLTKVFNNIGGRKVGYLVYNRFSFSFHDELNAAFAYLKSENINELVLDLRFNPGGTVSTSAYLASMIYANAGTGKFAELTFNSKRSVENDSYDFENTLSVYNVDGEFTRQEPINRLNTIDKLYILTTGGTASASEMVINGLRPYMGTSNVKLIGETTAGKNVGSITLYDSPSKLYADESSANPNHKYALQPIVFQIYNKNGESDYIQGFEPDIEVHEYETWYDILPFGDENELLLKTALDQIRGVATKSFVSKFKNTKAMDDSKFENKSEQVMYIKNDFLKKQ
tara:strand:+ start:329513 stop:331000 length:1488 start_codon:yes stop_codon:yes gene_type:complete